MPIHVLPHPEGVCAEFRLRFGRSPPPDTKCVPHIRSKPGILLAGIRPSPSHLIERVRGGIEQFQNALHAQSMVFQAIIPFIFGRGHLDCTVNING